MIVRRGKLYKTVPASMNAFHWKVVEYIGTGNVESY